MASEEQTEVAELIHCAVEELTGLADRAAGLGLLVRIRFPTRYNIGHHETGRGSSPPLAHESVEVSVVFKEYLG